MPTCIICGANGSIGSYLVKELDKVGYKIISLGRNNCDIYCDFSKPELIRLESDIIKDIDVIIFAQGLNPTKGFFDILADDFIEMFNVNIVSSAIIIRAVHNRMSKHSSVIFFSSIAAQKGSYDPSYATAKSATNGLVQTLSNNFDNIRFNIISLGLVEGTKVHKGMTSDFILKHKNKMFENELIKLENIYSLVNHIIANNNLNRTTINLDGGYQL